MPKDSWDIFEIIAKLASGILIPVVIFVLGLMFRRQKDRNDAEQRTADRLATVLKHLASDNDRERLLVVKVVQHLANNGQLPAELTPALATIAITDEHSGSIAADILGASTSSPKLQEKVFATDVLEPLMSDFDTGFKALKEYFSTGSFEPVEEMAQANMRARDLLVSKAQFIPQALLSDANKLVVHYDNWLSGFRKTLTQMKEIPGKADPFAYIAAPAYPFPSESQIAFRNAYKKYQEAEDRG